MSVGWLAMSVGWLALSVGWLVGLLVTHLYDDPQVAPYWPTWPCSSVVLCFRCCSPLFIVVVVVFYSLLLSC